MLHDVSPNPRPARPDPSSSPRRARPTSRCDYDEALTLATALLACGAVAVVGSRWAVPDRTTAAVMFAFHHFLAIEGLPPADALRAAQLWMLDLPRSALPGMSPELARLARRPSLAELETWAAFGHHGR